MGFDWSLVEKTCPGVVSVIPTGAGLALVQIDVARTKFAQTYVEGEDEDDDSIAPPGQRALQEVTDCVKGHGLEIVSIVNSAGSFITFRVRRKITAGLWQRLGPYRDGFLVPDHWCLQGSHHQGRQAQDAVPSLD